MAAIETEQQITLKLMVIKEKNKVLFAEAGKDFVDVLFSFLTLPLGTIVRLVHEESNMQPIEVGSLSSLYQSVENLDKECLSTDTCKEMLLRPKNSLEAYCKSLKLNIDDTEPIEYFACNNLINCQHNSPVLISTFKNERYRCRCGNMLDKAISPQSSNVIDGFVKSNATFLIMDDLKVVPNSLNTFFYLFKNCGIENMSSVNEMTVTITRNQVRDLLKGCLLSKTALTDSFLEKKLLFERFITTKFPPCDFNANGGSKINVRIMQRKSSGKIVLVQGKEDFAGFLFSFLTFPLGGGMHLMEGCSSMGSIDGLYKSVVDLDEDYWITTEVKNNLVEGVASHFILSNQLLPIYHGPEYFCFTAQSYANFNRFGEGFNPYLSACYLTTSREEHSKIGKCTALDVVDLISKTGNSKGFVKGPTMYMATDDLIVTPMSSISVVSLLTSMSIPFSDLEEKEVSIGVKEGVSILQASLTSKSALTTGLSHLLTEVKEEN